MSQNYNHRVTFDRIKRIINEVDPVNLIAGGAPEDEYDSEVAKIIRIMGKTENREMLSFMINDIFYKNFGENIEERKLNEMVAKLSQF